MYPMWKTIARTSATVSKLIIIELPDFLLTIFGTDQLIYNSWYKCAVRKLATPLEEWKINKARIQLSMRSQQQERLEN